MTDRRQDPTSPSAHGAPWSTADHHGRPVVATAPVRPATVATLHAATGLGPNVREHELVDPAWQVDDHCTVLGRESPGPPEHGGVHARAWEAVREYRMVDPAIVRACWYAGERLPGRLLVLEGRFGPLRFTMPVRIGVVREGRVRVGERWVHVAGWDYTTLAGHLERGRQDWTVWKWEDDGTVEFRSHVVSRRARIANPVVALGMGVFGRGMQVLSARRTAARLRALVGAQPDVGEFGGCTPVGTALRDLDLT